MKINWNKNCSYDDARKRLFHLAARARLRRLAGELGFPPGTFDLRSNKGGVAVSGEITLHHEQVYIQVSQSALGRGMGMLIRTCEGRRDYRGGLNNFVPLEQLDDVPTLATKVRMIAPDLARLAA